MYLSPLLILKLGTCPHFAFRKFDRLILVILKDLWGEQSPILGICSQINKSIFLKFCPYFLKFRVLKLQFNKNLQKIITVYLRKVIANLSNVPAIKMIFVVVLMLSIWPRRSKRLYHHCKLIIKFQVIEFVSRR